jgi:hypothetical protein
MAIRPVDLQLAYLAAPQNAAQVNHDEQAAAQGQQAAQTAFAAQVQRREETVARAEHAENTGIRTGADGGGNAGQYSPQGRRQDASSEEPDDGPASDGEHLIDFTA